MKDRFSCAVGEETRHGVRCEALRCGGDWTVAVTGGEVPHVGAVTLAEYTDETGAVLLETHVFAGHRDDTVSIAWAEELSRVLRCRVCVSAGLHVDRASAEDIAALLENSKKCRALLLSELGAENGAGGL